MRLGFYIPGLLRVMRLGLQFFDVTVPPFRLLIAKALLSNIAEIKNIPVVRIMEVLLIWI
jgi:hypothetical protein